MEDCKDHKLIAEVNIRGFLDVTVPTAPFLEKPNLKD